MANLIYPVLRRAEFSLPTGKIKEDNAKRIAEEIKNSWQSIIAKHSSAIKSVLDIDSIVVGNDREKDALVTEDGFDAFIVDNPIITAQWQSYTFEVRTTIAVCYQEKSTKNWTRVSLTEPISEDNSDFKVLKSLYHKIADKCCSISHKEFTNIVESNEAGDFEVMTFGVEDENLGSYLEEIDDQSIKLKDLFAKPENKELIQNYYSSLFNINLDEVSGNNEDNYWLGANSSLLSSKGYFDNNNVLYKVLYDENNNSLFAWGLGYENSEEKELAHLSSLQIAKLYAKRI